MDADDDGFSTVSLTVGGPHDCALVVDPTSDQILHRRRPDAIRNVCDALGMTGGLMQPASPAPEHQV
jgi:hypothetical protein